MQVMRHGVGLSTSSDSELIIQLLALTPPMEELDAPDWVARSVLRLDAAFFKILYALSVMFVVLNLCYRIKNLMSETPTSYSLLVMFKDVIYAVRDPYGNRPLCIGRLVPISKLHSSGTLNVFVLVLVHPPLLIKETCHQILVPDQL